MQRNYLPIGQDGRIVPAKGAFNKFLDAALVYCDLSCRLIEDVVKCEWSIGAKDDLNIYKDDLGMLKFRVECSFRKWRFI